MADEKDRDRTTDERFGRRVHEGMNAGISRNAHTSGEFRPVGREAEEVDAASAQGSPTDRGAGGYGDDTGFTGGTRAAGTSNTGGTTETGMNTGGTGPTGGTNTGGTTGGTTGGQAGGAHRAHSSWAGTPAVSHHDGVGREAPSGMEELEHDAREGSEP